ncbi:hypothetical protein ACM66B_006194 [Microbotryomycetes sp. NB124-2]
MVMAPSWLDLTFVEKSLLHHKGLREKFNIIGVELRGHGRSKGPFSAQYDHFVGAAEIALLMKKLNLAPCHMFATGAFACAVVFKLSLIFPSLVLSMALVGARSVFAEPTQKQILEELTTALAEPVDEDEFNEASLPLLTAAP